MKKVLIITYYWPPSGGPGVQRWLKFSKYLRDFNIDPIIVTVKEDAASYPVMDSSLNNEIPKEIKVYKTDSFEPLKIFSSLFKKEKVPYAGIPDFDKLSLIGKLSLFIRANFFIPDARVGWNKYAFNKCCEIIEQEKIDFIITTSPPHSTQLIGLRLKEKYKLIWLADLRDPWTDIYYYNQFRHTQAAKAKDRDLEKKVLEIADLITVTSEHTRKLFTQKVGLKADKIKIITNGYDAEDFTDIDELFRTEKFTISFSGTINKQFGLTTFIEVIETLNTEGYKIQLQFVGNIEMSLQNELKEKIKHNLSLINYVSHKEAIDYTLKSNILLLVIPDGKNQGTIPGKTFEYLATQNPILCLCPTGADAGVIIEQNNAGKAITHNDSEKIREFILSYYKKWENGETIRVNNSNFKKFSRKETTKQLADIIFQSK